MRIPVREVSRKGQSTLVEWVDEENNLNRASVPTTEIVRENGEVLVENPEEGAPYGEEWENLIRARLGPKGIANLLRKNGIWTYQDYVNNTATVTSVFNQACTVNLQHFRETVRLRQTQAQEEKED